MCIYIVDKSNAVNNQFGLLDVILKLFSRKQH